VGWLAVGFLAGIGVVLAGCQYLVPHGDTQSAYARLEAAVAASSLSSAMRRDLLAVIDAERERLSVT
jgi:hypothetical protein